jgi:hypothetical protein
VTDADFIIVTTAIAVVGLVIISVIGFVAYRQEPRLQLGASARIVPQPVNMHGS